MYTCLLLFITNRFSSKRFCFSYNCVIHDRTSVDDEQVANDESNVSHLIDTLFDVVSGRIGTKGPPEKIEERTNERIVRSSVSMRTKACRRRLLNDDETRLLHRRLDFEQLSQA